MAASTVSGPGSGASATATSSNSAASISSLFERVTNFRRSLIKNHQRKKSRSAWNSPPDASKPPPPPPPVTEPVSESEPPTPPPAVQVDEEDAIYGFTSTNLNNPKRRVLKCVPPPPTDSTQLLARISSSSSCISLYETIDGCEDGTGPASRATAKYCKANNKSSRHHSRIYSPGATSLEPEWRRAHRRSSAILLAGESEPAPPPPPPHGPTTARSSDDLLISIAATGCNQRKCSDAGLQPPSSARIYENLGPIPNEPHRSSNHQRNKCHFPDPRKLTKDSGYESSSTLVSLSNAISSSGYGLLSVSTSRTVSSTISNPNLLAVEHARSDSIDSSLSHKSFDSPSTVAPAVASPAELSGDDVDRESLPPTPPTRYSSLPEHYRAKQRSDESDGSRMVSWPYGLAYPRMNRWKLHRATADENPYDNQDAPSIKEIQKRAVYEFYLRQKEKKARQQPAAAYGLENHCEAPEPPPPPAEPSLLQRPGPVQCTDVDDIDVIPPPPLPPPPPPRPVATVEPNLERNREQPPLPEPPEKSPEQFPPPPPPALTEDPGEQAEWKKPSLDAVLQLLDQRQLDLIKLWPSVDFSPLLPMLMVVFNNAPDDDDDDEAEPASEHGEAEPELIRIDQNRKWKHRMLSRSNLLLMERARIEAELARNEKLAQFIRHRLGQLDAHQARKLDLLVTDMGRITGLIFSLHRQLVEPVGGSAEKLARLSQQLEQARQLRDAVQQRGTMFLQRLEHRFGQLGYGQLLNMIMAGHQPTASCEPAPIPQPADIISAMFEHDQTSPDGQDINLASMSRSYLARLQMLTVQRHLLDFLIGQQQQIGVAHSDPISP